MWSESRRTRVFGGPAGCGPSATDELQRPIPTTTATTTTPTEAGKESGAVG